jgi:mRNA interferase RelE/StbE
MVWKIEFDPNAEKEIAKLDRQIAKRILTFLHKRVSQLENPRAIGEPLKGSRLGDFWKYRVGDYRVIVCIEDDILRILVVKVGHRKKVYKVK